MNRNSLLALMGALVLLAGGAALVPALLADPETPTVRWTTNDEVEVSNEPAELANADDASATPASERSEVLLGAAPTDANDRVEVLLRGRVIDKWKAPVAAATVWLDFGRGGGRGGQGGQGGGARQRRVPDPVQTDNEGRFAFQGQTFRNLRVSLQVAHPRHAPGQFDKDMGNVATEVDLGDLTLMNGGQVRGRVTDLDGNGIPGAELRLQAANANPLRTLRDRDRMLPAFQTDNNGNYILDHAAVGDWSLTAVAKRHTEGRSSTFAVEEDQVVDVEDIRLGPGYEITGTVRDARGQPIAKATVAMQSEGRGRGRPGGGPSSGPSSGGGQVGGRGPSAGGREHRTTTDERGNFFMEHLPSAPMRLEVDAEGFLDFREAAVDPTRGQPINVTLQDGLRIEGKVTDADGSAVALFAFRAVRVRGLPPPGQPSVDLNALMSRMRDASLSEADRAELRTQMESLRGQMGGRGGRGGPPDDNGSGNGQGNGGGRGGQRDLGRAESHPDGAFAATGLQEGIYEVSLQSPEHARYRSAEVEVRWGAPTPQLAIVLDGGVFVAGLVKNANGDAVRGARVELRTPSAFEPPRL